MLLVCGFGKLCVLRDNQTQKSGKGRVRVGSLLPGTCQGEVGGGSASGAGARNLPPKFPTPYYIYFLSFHFLSVHFDSFRFLSVSFGSFRFLFGSFWLISIPFGLFRFLLVLTTYDFCIYSGSTDAVLEYKYKVYHLLTRFADCGADNSERRRLYITTGDLSNSCITKYSCSTVITITRRNDYLGIIN